MSSIRLHPLLVAFLLTAAGSLAVVTPAHADSCDINRSQLSCGSIRTSSVDWSFWSAIGDLFNRETYRSCGVGHDYDQPQDVWTFTCNGEHEAQIRLQNQECNMDLFVLKNNCDGDVGPCAGSSTFGGRSNDFVTFFCERTSIYYLIVERYDENLVPWFQDCTRWEDFSYTIAAECYENCDDRIDNDLDGLVDCKDPECPVCVEDCFNNEDDDLDGLVDCADPDCAAQAICCDVDNDGFTRAGPLCGGNDCNDNDPDINPGVAEIPADGVDQNCDTTEDCYVDGDGDFYGTSRLTQSTSFFCLAPGVANNPDDCDDADPDINPSAPEQIATGFDENCDGLETCYVDADNDDYGSTTTIETSDIPCTASGVSLNADDCDDSDPNVNPGMPVDFPVNGKDDDCDGFEICFEDLDGDGYGRQSTTLTTRVDCIGSGVSPRNDDCNDDPATGGGAVFPGATEIVANGIDDNCDTFETCWLDGDRDGFGNSRGDTTTSVLGTDPVSGEVICADADASLDPTDCDDSNPNIFPGAVDPAGDGIDQNCDAENDCYVDADGDGWGSTLTQSNVPGCAAPGLSPLPGDCNDANTSINPGATEQPADGVDQDCDGLEICWRDGDEDGFGNDQGVTTTSPLTTGPGGVILCADADASLTDNDCNDGDDTIFPGAVEGTVVDGIDQNCDGREVCYVDNDNDGFGNAAGTTKLSVSLDCSAAGVSPNTDDCNDTRQDINPSRPNIVASGTDEDCSGVERCYVDQDNDAWGSDAIVSSPDLTCLGRDVTNAVDVAARAGDCDDGNNLVYPGAPTPTPADPGTDYACDGFVTCFQDSDGDGFGSNIPVASGDALCSGGGVSDNSLDCNDGDPNVKPTGVEIRANGIDENCDGLDLCFQDLDGDGFGTSIPASVSLPGSCNSPALGVSDNDDDCNDDPDNGGATAYPGAPEIVANGIDDNCNNLEACYIDADRDTFGADPNSTGKNPVEIAILSCVSPGYSPNADDCDDTLFNVKPNGTEVPGDGLDQDCDGLDACYVDQDNDNWGSNAITTGPLFTQCAGPNIAPRNGDCVDSDPTIFPADPFTGAPGGVEIPGDGVDSDCDLSELCYVDNDDDGWGGNQTIQQADMTCGGLRISPRTGDCDDVKPDINPDAVDIPADGIDQDCNGLFTCYLDQDRDGFGGQSLTESGRSACDTIGASDNDLDCLDTPPQGANVYPGAPESAGDGLDQNCDGFELCFVDQDRDSYGGGATTLSESLTCEEAGISASSDDCNDLESAINPGATDQPPVPGDLLSLEDEDCNGLFTCYQDNDGDTYGIAQTRESNVKSCIAPRVANNPDDCVDTLPGGDAIYPGAPEVFSNGIDENCDTLESCFRDEDGDGFGDGAKPPVNTPALDCVAVNAAPQGGDCDDRPGIGQDIYPGATETAVDGIDQDCDGGDDCYLDRDGDGFGDASGNTIKSPNLSCTDGALEADNARDCVDVGTILGVRAEDINPDAQEVCNGVDDDCDSTIDDADPSVQASFFWYADSDDDGFGTTSSEVARCTPPDEDWVTNSGDCNDGNPLINPGAQEICDPNNVDEDCNGLADDDDVDPNNPALINAEGAVIVYPDNDSDGWGVDDPTRAYETCDPGDRTSERTGDCNDADPVVNPGQDEIVYDGKDNDCDPLTPDDDLDGDGFPKSSDCNDVPGIGASIFPGATEVCNGIDDNCDSLKRVDEGTSCFDDDGDGFTEDAGDCNDANANVYPGAPELPNNADDDCDGIRDEGTERYDDDGDGFCERNCVQAGVGPGDCNDGDPSVNPGLAEIMGNGKDDDCDGGVDGGVYDPDGDGYTALGGDCDESDPNTFPFAPERPNGKDDDCDTLVDEGTRRYDDDGDGYCETDCIQPGVQPGDCDDNNEQTYPGAPEDLANGVDDDCDGDIDEGGDKSDDDGDGFAENEGDCDDNDRTVYPGAPEQPDGKDNDCDGEVDEGLVDVDGDGISVEQGDCDDNNGWVSPEQVETCDGLDNDCDGEVDEGLVDCGTFDASDDIIPRTCGCAATTGAPAGGSAWLVGLGLVGLLRRRRGAKAA